MNFDLFCNKQEKKLVTAITFAYDIEITQIICQKNREKNPSSNPPGLPGQQFTDSSNSKTKKFISNRRFFAAKSKKFKNFKKFKNSKKDTEMYNKEDC